MDDRALFHTHMEDLVLRAQKTGMAHSKFLTASETAELQTRYANRADITLNLEGGFAEAERCVAVFTHPDWGNYIPDELLAGLSLRHRPQDFLRHQDILGAILALGLSRDILGDIYPEPGLASTVCLLSMARFICAELQKAGRVGLSIEQIPLAHLPALSTKLEEKQVTVASLRLDAVLSATFNWSRTDAAEAIRAGRVQLAHQECTNVSKPVTCGDVFSVRGKGRVKLLAVNDLSRKGRLKIVLGIFV